MKSNVFQELPKEILSTIVDSQSDPFEKDYLAMNNPLLRDAYEDNLKNPFHWSDLLENDYAIILPNEYSNDFFRVYRISSLISGFVLTTKEAELSNQKGVVTYTYPIRDYPSFEIGKLSNRYTFFNKNFLSVFDIIGILVYNIERVDKKNGLYDYYNNILDFFNKIYLTICKDEQLGLKFDILWLEKTLSLKNNKHYTVFEESLQKVFDEYLSGKIPLEIFTNYNDLVRRKYPKTDFLFYLRDDQRRSVEILKRVFDLETIDKSVFEQVNREPIFLLYKKAFQPKQYKKEIKSKDFHISDYFGHRIPEEADAGDNYQAALRKPVKNVVDFLLWLVYGDRKIEVSKHFKKKLVSFLEDGNEEDVAILNRSVRALIRKEDILPLIYDIPRYKTLYENIVSQWKWLSGIKRNVFLEILGEDPKLDKVVKTKNVFAKLIDEDFLEAVLSLEPGKNTDEILNYIQKNFDKKVIGRALDRLD